jgi:hypothetical protein
MTNLIVEQHFPEPVAEDQYNAWAKRLDPCLEARGARWVRSYISRDRRHIVCEFEGPDADAVRDSYRSAELPFERVWPAEVFASEASPKG